MNEKKESSEEISYWNNFYATHYAKKVLSIPSQFCCLMATEIEMNDVIVEFGCGTGRDSIFLANNDFNVLAMDSSPVVIEKNTEITKSISNISFYCVDVAIKNDVVELLNQGRKISNKNIIVYSRFFLHSLDNKQESIFIECLSEELIKGDKLYFEFRTNLDFNRKKIYENHFRRFVDNKKLINNLKNYGFDINYHFEGAGMAKYKQEDPVVGRIVAEKL